MKQVIRADISISTGTATCLPCHLLRSGWSNHYCPIFRKRLKKGPRGAAMRCSECLSSVVYKKG